MSKFIKGLKIFLKFIGIFILVILILHFVGTSWNKKVPEGGINESMYVDINGTKEWINIYGEDLNNPVLLYLHGGPGSSTSEIDYAFTRKWADIYTVVSWDQRNCGKSYVAGQKDVKLTREIFMEDGKEITDFIRNYLNVDKISILGHSWGSMYGANLVLEYPDCYNLFVGAGQFVDSVENDEALKAEAYKWAKGDEETLKLIDKINPGEIDYDSIKARNRILKKYGYSMMKDGTDYFPLTTVLFNHNYSIKDWAKCFNRDRSAYDKFLNSDEFKSFSLKGRYEYKVPYVNINGDMDYQVNYKLAEEYFNSITAPEKDLYIMKDTTHGLMISKSEEFSNILHQIRDKYGEKYE